MKPAIEATFIICPSLFSNILSKNTGKTLEQIELDTERDNYLNAEEAVKYGIVDKIIK